MTRLKLINVSNSISLDKAPLGWAYVPNEQLIIDLHGSKQFYALPFQLCSVHTNLTTLNVAGTVAEFTIDWKRQLSATTVQSFDMNSACLVALEKLKTLSLADNNLKLRCVLCIYLCQRTQARVSLTVSSIPFFFQPN